MSASTQNQAKSALLFLYKEVLGIELPWLDKVQSAKTPSRLPVVLTREEVQKLLGHLQGTNWLVVSLLYGTGMRILEALRLRVKDVDFTRYDLHPCFECYNRKGCVRGIYALKRIIHTPKAGAG